MKTNAWAKRMLAMVASIVFAMLFCCAKPAAAQQRNDQLVTLETTKGRIVMRVFYSMVPNTAGNFLDLVNRGFYKGLTFHRVESWVLQGGDPNGNGTGVFIDPDTGRPRTIRLEINRNLTHNMPGMVAMARGNNPNSASCQFYILKRAMPQLNNNYAVFGRVLEGMNVVYAMQPGDRILNASILTQEEQNAPASAQGFVDQGGFGSVRQNAAGMTPGRNGGTAPPSGDSGF